MNRRFYYISNVFEESVKRQRCITSDSPAATRKVTSLCRAVRLAGGDAEIISLGRGRNKGTWKSYPVVEIQSDSVPITYLRYLDAPVLTHLITMFSLLAVVINKSSKDSVFIFYNFFPHHLLALLFCWIKGCCCILDIEDGCRKDDKNIRNLPNSWLMKIHNVCCRSGVMLAATGLTKQSAGQRTYVCYGVADSFRNERDWLSGPLQIHFGGSLMEETGAVLFLEALDLLMSTNPEMINKLKFIVTGFGPYADVVKQVACGRMENVIEFYGNVSQIEYIDIIQRSHVGLCLKMPDSSMGATTFPSKVVELASNGLLLVSTRVSDVPMLFDETNAFLLDVPTPFALSKVFEKIVRNPENARNIAIAGQNKILSQLSEEKIGKELLQFWLGSDSI